MELNFADSWNNNKAEYGEAINKWFDEEYDGFYYINYIARFNHINDILGHIIIEISNANSSCQISKGGGAPYKIIYVQHVKDFVELKSIIKKIIAEYECIFDNELDAEYKIDNHYLLSDMLYGYARGKYGWKYKVVEKIDGFTINNEGEAIVYIKENNLVNSCGIKYTINIMDFVMIKDVINKLDEIMEKYEKDLMQKIVDRINNLEELK